MVAYPPRRSAKCYSIHLWGERAWSALVTQSEKNRKSVKEFILHLEGMIEVFDTKSLRVATLLKAAPDLSDLPGSTFRHLWREIVDRYEIWIFPLSVVHRRILFI